jgi:hypothetical protein
VLGALEIVPDDAAGVNGLNFNDRC